MSKRFPWYKRFPSDAIAGMIGLDPAQKGVYGVMIDLCYDRSGPIADDEAELARISGCSKRLFRKLRDDLLAKGKVRRLADGRLIVKGFRHGSDEFRGDFDEVSRVENQSKIDRKLLENRSNGTAPEPKTTGYEASSRGRARAQGQILEARVDSTRFKPTKAIPEIALAIRLCKELGVDFDPSSDRKNWPGLIRRMIEDDGLEFEAHILGAVIALRSAGKLPDTVRTPTFFRGEAQRIAAQRLLPAPPQAQAEDPSTITRQAWTKRIVRFLECGYWRGPGPDPLALACMAPPDMLEAARARWQAQANHPVFADAEGNFPWKPKAGSRGMGSDIFPEARPLEVAPPSEARA